MNSLTGAALAEEIRAHTGLALAQGQVGNLLALLRNIEMPESSRFYESFPTNSEGVPDSGRQHYFSLRRGLRNGNALTSSVPEWKKGIQKLISLTSRYSSSALTRDLRLDEEILKMMYECPEPFSLLGKLRTVDYEKSHNIFIITRPVLIIPGQASSPVVSAWEDSHTIYRQERRLLGIPVSRHVSQREYLSH